MEKEGTGKCKCYAAGAMLLWMPRRMLKGGLLSRGARPLDITTRPRVTKGKLHQQQLDLIVLLIGVLGGGGGFCFSLCARHGATIKNNTIMTRGVDE